MYSTNHTGTLHAGKSSIPASTAPAVAVHLAIAFDQNYVRHFFALFSSIVNNNVNGKINVHAIITGIDTTTKDLIKQFAASFDAAIHFYEIDEDFVKKFVLTSHWSSAVYYRLLFPMLVPETVTKLLYLDTDIVVLKDITALYTTDLEGHPVAAVYDNWVKKAPQLGIEEEGHYFNSGMMLMNLPVWKREQISEQCFAYLAQYPERIFFVDQDALNAVLIGKWKKLDFKYNVLHSRIPEGMTTKEKERFLHDKVLLHFTLQRPWKMLCENPFRHLYHYYLKKSPYQIRDRYDDFSMQKIPGYFKIKLVELYHNLPLLKHTWRRMKSGIRGEEAAGSLNQQL